MTGLRSFVFDDSGEAKRHAPATTRNRDAISALLAKHLLETGNVLEIASGTGEHILHFAAEFPHLQWQPSDMEPAALQSITAWSMEAKLDNVAPPILLDVLSKWPNVKADAVLCINMLHISPSGATTALFAGAAELLSEGALLFIYGPFIQVGVETAQSNLDFDRSLKERNAQWGLRDVDAVSVIAAEHGFTLSENVEMPANNRSLIYRRR